MSNNRKQDITLIEPREDNQTLKVMEKCEAQNQTIKFKHQDPLVRQIGINFRKFADDLGGHITTLGKNITKDIKGLNNPNNLRIDKKIGESKRRTSFSRAKASEEDDKPNNIRKRKILSKTYFRDKSQRQELQR